MSLPGDEARRNPAFEIQHAVTIDAPPEAVWPWLVQLGQNRAGFYSYDWLERPCTHIDAASDQRLPVVAFHCTHLNRAPGPRPSVTRVSLGEPNGTKKLTEFQFAGKLGAHGAPNLR